MGFGGITASSHAPEWAEIPYRGGAQATAVSGKSRLPQLPDVPTIAESGLPGFETGTYQGLMATGGTPAPIVRQIADAVHAALRQPDITARLASLGTDPTPNSPEEFKRWFDASVVSWAKIVKDAGVKVE